MKKDIQLCGLGNGLVDIQYEVSDDELKNLKLKKGEMRLVENDEQRKLIDKFAHRKHHKSSGGSAANTVIAFSLLGGKAAYKTTLGNDKFGLFYAKEFTDLGIVLKARLIDTHPTGTCFVFVTPDSERTMNTSLGASAEFGEAEIDEEIIARSEWLYIEGYKFTQENSTLAVYKAVDLAKKQGTKIAVTFSDSFITEIFKDNLKKTAEMADLIFCNENEAQSYTGKKDTAEAYKELKRIAPNVIVTKSEAGSLIHWNGGDVEVPAYKTIPVDSTGAGDMYAGAFLYGIINTGSPAKAGHLASYAASRIVSQFGARLIENIIPEKDRIFREIDC
ncbi:MAG: adenosine kinase [Candidatus Kapaibacterium sp.]